jgi:hypothetical protein
VVHEVLGMIPESCCDSITHQLGTIQEIMNTGLDQNGTLIILGIIGLTCIEEQFMGLSKIWPRPKTQSFLSHFELEDHQ